MSPLHDLRIYALRYPPGTRPYKVGGTPVHPQGWGRTAGLQRWILYRRFLTLFTRHHRQHRYDLIHAFWGEEPGFLATRLGRRLGLPSLVSLVGGELAALKDIGYGSLLGLQTRRMVQLALGDATAVVAPSRQMAQRALDRCPQAAGRLRRIPLGVNRSLFSSPQVSSPPSGRGDSYLLHISNLSPVKDPGLLLGTFQMVRARHREIDLRIVGGESAPAWWKDRLQDDHLSKSVICLGWKEHDQLAPYYHSARLLLMTSRYEGYMGVAPEALSCGCPVVSTDVGVVSELSPPIEKVDEHKPEPLAERVLMLLENEERRRRLSRAGTEAVRDYDLEIMVSKYQEEYGRLADLRAHPPRSRRAGRWE